MAYEPRRRLQEEVLSARVELRLPAHGQPDHREVPGVQGHQAGGREVHAAGPSGISERRPGHQEGRAGRLFSTINGDSNVNFYNELAAQGITADKIPVVAVSVGEDELRGLDPNKVKGHLAAWNYFQSIDNSKNKEFVKKFQDFTKDPQRVTDDPIEAAYMGVYFWKMAVEKAGSTDVDKVREAFKSGIEFDAPGGKVKLDPKTQHTFKRFFMGKTRDDKQFDVIHKTDLIEPVPYPQVAFPGWGCDWTKGGVTKGAEVKVGS
jgi:urea transport system substrate-binding protein